MSQFDFRNLQRLVNAREVGEGEIERQCVHVVVELLREGVGEAHKRRIDMRTVRLARLT